MNYKRTLCLTALTVTAAALASCGPKQPSPEEAKAAFCTALATYNQALASFTALSGSSTVGQFKEARKQLQMAQAGIEKAEQMYRQARISQLKTSFEQLNQAIDTVPNSATLAQAKQSVAPAVKGVQTAWQDAKTQAQCP